MGFCLPFEQVEKFKRALTSGEINPGELAQLSSAERRAALEKFVGEADAREVNALFESKLLLKNQQKGMVAWAEKVMGDNPTAKKDMLSKINKLDKVLDPGEKALFLEDLASKRLGVDVTFEEAKQLVDYAKKIEEKKAAIPENSAPRSAERMEYGTEYTKYREYVEGLKVNSESMSFTDYLKRPGKALTQIAGTAKSIAASLDNSFFGRQGIKVLYTNPDIWARNFVKSWEDIGRSLAGQDAMLPVKADIYSRPNAINGKYADAKVAIGLATEEAFPSSLPERIPVLGRLFKASETAYNAAALRMRADMADRVFAKAEKLGRNMKSKEELQSLGKLVNSLTGRGDIGKLNVIGNEINSAVFSIKFLKSNFDTLTAHAFDGSMTKYAKKEAALNLLKIVGATAAILTTAEMLNPGSVDWDPRSSKFGKIKIGENHFDVTGGMGSIVTLASRLVPTTHKGKWGWWTKSGTKFNELGTGKFGSLTPMDYLYRFGEGKASPTFKVLIDILKQEDFNGDKPTFVGEAKNLVTPIPIQNFMKLREAGGGGQLLTMILDGLGLAATVPKSK